MHIILWLGRPQNCTNTKNKLPNVQIETRDPIVTSWHVFTISATAAY